MLDNYQDLIDELLGTPQFVREFVAGGDERALRLVVALLARDRLVLERVQRIRQTRDPYLKPIPDVEALIAGAETTSDRDTLLATFEHARGDLVSLLMNLTLRDWERTAITDDEGSITLADEVEAHVEFDEQLRDRFSSM